MFWFCLTFVVMLGWLYSVFAHYWIVLFRRDLIAHAVREAYGYRLGRAIYWQLPAGGAIIVAAACAVPLLAWRAIPGVPAAVVTVVFAAAIIALWLIYPPGQRMGLSEQAGAGQAMSFERITSTRPWYGLAVFGLFGVIPALFLTSGLSFLGSLWLR
jgi:hypothetical protein